MIRPVSMDDANNVANCNFYVRYVPAFEDVVRSNMEENEIRRIGCDPSLQAATFGAECSDIRHGTVHPKAAFLFNSLERHSTNYLVGRAPSASPLGEKRLRVDPGLAGLHSLSVRRRKEHVDFSSQPVYQKSDPLVCSKLDVRHRYDWVPIEQVPHVFVVRGICDHRKARLSEKTH